MAVTQSQIEDALRSVIDPHTDQDPVTAKTCEMLIPNPDIGLDILHQMPKVNRAIGVR